MSSTQLNLTLGQSLNLTPEMQRSLNILAASALELRGIIGQEVVLNPVIEEGPEIPADTPQDLPEDLRTLIASDTDEPGWKEIALSKIPEPDDLRTALMRFGRLAPPGVAELIEALDERGYLAADTPDSSALEYLHEHATPAGIGARDLIECFKIQLKRRGLTQSMAWVILTHARNEFVKYNVAQICALLQQPESVVRNALATLARLTPYPGSTQPTAPATDPEITFTEAGFEVHRDNVPRIHVSRYYVNMARRADPETKAWLAERIKSARTLMKALDRRQSTLSNLAGYIFQHQRAFIEHGYKALRPMTMAQIAAALNLHETTIGRAVAGKWAEAPWGPFALRTIFTTPMTKVTGETVSNETVKRRIAEVLTGGRMTDEQLVAQLNREGFIIARRTVTKYRTQLGIPANTQR